MTAWIIISSVFLLILVFLLSPIRIFVEVQKNEQMRLKIAFWFFKIAEIPSVDKTAKKPKEVAPKNKKKTPLNIRVKTYDDVIELFNH